ncbi:MAG: hypothetical protein HYU28_03255 [Actinobacteria bacterium]|nr:hypothetical protein [Actinomycetota bacterium]
MPDVRLVDLQLIRRYSLAVRQESADAAELLEVLDADRAALQKAVKGRAPRARSTSTGRASRTSTSRTSTTRRAR